MTRHMKKKIPLKQKIYLPEYFKGNVAQSFQKESNQRLLYWDFDNDLDETDTDTDRNTSEMPNRKNNKKQRNRD